MALFFVINFKVAVFSIYILMTLNTVLLKNILWQWAIGFISSCFSLKFWINFVNFNTFTFKSKKILTAHWRKKVNVWKKKIQKNPVPLILLYGQIAPGISCIIPRSFLMSLCDRFSFWPSKLLINKNLNSWLAFSKD